jgi:hypothetical protein
MKLWMSAEIQSDVADDYRSIRKPLEVAFNSRFGDEEYGLDEFNYIAVIRAIESADFPEVCKFRQHEKSAEFRLRIPYTDFRQGDLLRKRVLVCDSLIRAIRMLSQCKFCTVDPDALEAEFIRLTKNLNWSDDSL